MNERQINREIDFHRKKIEELVKTREEFYTKNFQKKYFGKYLVVSSGSDIEKDFEDEGIEKFFIKVEEVSLENSIVHIRGLYFSSMSLEYRDENYFTSDFWGKVVLLLKELDEEKRFKIISKEDFRNNFYKLRNRHEIDFEKML